MTDTRAGIPSLADRARPLAAGAPVVAAHFLQETAVFVLGEEALLLLPRAGESRRIAVHAGAVLSSTANVSRVVTGGDDGKVMATDADGNSTTVGTDANRSWIDHVAVGPSGALAWSAGRDAFVRTGTGAERTLALQSTVGGLAFAPKGLRLAIAHYNGVTLWFANMAAKPEFLEWAGSHLGVIFSPDNKFLVTSMHEPALHGWRLADNRHMRMSGYPGRVSSMSWSAGGKGLAN